MSFEILPIRRESIKLIRCRNKFSMTGLFVIFPELVCSLILLCHPELVSGSYQLEVKALSWLDAEIILNFPYGSGNPLFGFTLCSQNFACGALPPVGFFCSLSGLVSLRPSANPLHSVKTF